MNFFEHQDRARRNTSLLVLYFVLAILAISSIVSLAIFIALAWGSNGQYTLYQWLTSQAFWWCFGLTLIVIIAGSLHKFWQLRDGGEALAHMLGAREIPPDAALTDEHLLRNVVEEMALASGIPAPRTYLLANEKAVNAFVAGYRPSEAVVIVTQGTLDTLSRDELQGVMAHEFSHIFNADMRINMRLISILAGIVAIGKIGEFLLHGMRYRRRPSSNRDNQGGIVILGIALMVVGYVGLFFGRLIKAAISRQRELLADASAVQFTRNPAGLAGALIKIRNGSGSHLNTVHAEDMSHMCFGDTVPFHLKSLLATHPPIDERLTAIGGEWLARARVRSKQSSATESASQGSTVDNAQLSGFAPTQPHAAHINTQAPAATLSSQIGAAGLPQLGYAQSLYDAIPDDLKYTLRQPYGARLLIWALAIVSSNNDAESLLAHLTLNTAERQQLLDLIETLNQLGTRLRLPLFDLAVPTLKQLTPLERELLQQQLDTLVRADGKISLFEFVLTRLVQNHLAENAGRVLRVRFKRYDQVAADLQILLSLLVHASGEKDDAAAQLFKRSCTSLISNGRTLLPLDRCSMDALDRALENLRDLTPLLKGPLVDTLADMVLDDGKIQVSELELIRAVCSLIDCPIPPLNPSQRLAAR